MGKTWEWIYEKVIAAPTECFLGNTVHFASYIISFYCGTSRITHFSKGETDRLNSLKITLLRSGGCYLVT